MHKEIDAQIPLGKEPTIPILRKLNHIYLREPFIEPRGIVGWLSISISTRQQNKDTQYKHTSRTTTYDYMRLRAQT